MIGEKKESLVQHFGYLVVFSIAMGILEAVVIIYLRKISSMDGPTFYRKQVFLSFGFESIREASTVVMIMITAIMNGKNGLQKLANFLFIFAVVIVDIEV